MTTSKHLADLRALESENARLRADLESMDAHAMSRSRELRSLHLAHARLAAERDRARALAVALEQQVAAVAAVCARHERWPIDDEVSGFAPIDEIQAALGADQ